MHDHMSNLRPLATSRQHGKTVAHGETRPRRLRTGHTLDVLPAAAHMPKAQSCGRGCDGCPRQVAKQKMIAVTAQSWGVTG